MTSIQSRAQTALQQLAISRMELADVLADLIAVVAEEALQNGEFGARLSEVLLAGRKTTRPATLTSIQSTPVTPKVSPVAPRPKRGRRAPGPWDPYAIFAEVGESGLKERLGQLELEQLRDIIAEHGMNSDGLAMRWTKADRVIGRIIERVTARASKGDAFRSS